LSFAACRSQGRDEAAAQLRDSGTDMANTTSAKKAARKIARRTAANMVPRTRMRTFVRKVEEAIASGDKNAAREALKAAQPMIMKAATRGLLHRNTASRKVSRLSHRVEALA
jgi:small subunit ribosomal protein S20